MAEPLNRDLVQEFLTLQDCQGVRSVSRWKLPNDDVPFTEAEALADARANLDGYFDLTTRAITGIGGPEK